MPDVARAGLEIFAGRPEDSRAGFEIEIAAMPQVGKVGRVKPGFRAGIDGQLPMLRKPVVGTKVQVGSAAIQKRRACVTPIESWKNGQPHAGPKSVIPDESGFDVAVFEEFRGISMRREVAPQRVRCGPPERAIFI